MPYLKYGILLEVVLFSTHILKYSHRIALLQRFLPKDQLLNCLNL